MINGVSKVAARVGDQAQVKEFSTQRVGSETNRDKTYGEKKPWIGVSCRGTSMSLGRRS